jgi:hemolysin III
MKQLFAPCELDLMEHYADPLERAADKWVHYIGLALAAIGGVYLFWASFITGDMSRVTAVALYAACLISMLAASTAYNLSNVCPHRPLLRRADEAGIFLMIAGSYTPFTLLALDGWLSLAVTLLVWVIAIAGVIGKLVLPQLSDKVWTIIYAGFGWLAVLLVQPLIEGAGPKTMILVAAGGLIYTLGTLFFLNPKLRFRRAVWHGFVVTGAGTHYVAVLAAVGLLPL